MSELRRRTSSRPDEKKQTAAPASTVKIPHDVVNEQLLIAAAAGDWTGRGGAQVEVIPPDCFHGKGHAAIWATFQRMKREKLDYSTETTQQTGGDAVDATYLRGLLSSIKAPPNLKHHTEILRWDHARIATAEGPLGAFLEALRDQTADAGKVRALAKSVAESLSGHGSGKYLRDGGELVREVRVRLLERRNGLAVYPYGIKGLDEYGANEEAAGLDAVEGRARMVPGAAPGQLSVLTAVPGAGKTTALANMASGWFDQGRRVLFGAWEQGSSLTLELIAGIRLGYRRSDLLEGRYTLEDEAALGEECEKLAEYIRFFELPFGRARGGKEYNDTNMDLIQQVITDSGCSVFVADLFKRALKETNPDDEEQALYRMQAMAQETHVHFLFAQQQKAKEIEQSPDKRPTRSNIKGSSAWFEVPDTIIGLHREALWKCVPDTKLEAIIFKQRHGKWPLTVELDWDATTGRIGAGRSVAVVRDVENNADPLVGSQDPNMYRARRRR